MSRLKRFLRCWLNGHERHELNDLDGNPNPHVYTYVVFCPKCGKLLCGPEKGWRGWYGKVS